MVRVFKKRYNSGMRDNGINGDPTVLIRMAVSDWKSITRMRWKVQSFRSIRLMRYRIDRKDRIRRDSC